MGLREQKKQQTRQRIAETAQRMFADQGFDRATVAEIAREAEVAEATVFNYFPTKEDLFYSGLEAFGAQLVEAVTSRDASEPVLVAVRRFLLGSSGLLDQIEAGDSGALERVRTINRVISASPVLQAREQLVIARNADALAAVLAVETGVSPDDLTPQVAANALLGVHRAMIDYARRRLRDDDEPARLAADVRAHGTQAFALLEQGFGDYALGT